MKKPEVLAVRIVNCGELKSITDYNCRNLVTPQAGIHGRPRVDIKIEASKVPIVPNVVNVTE